MNQFDVPPTAVANGYYYKYWLLIIVIIISLFTHCNKNNDTIKKKKVNFTFQFKQMSFMTSSTLLLV